MRNPTSFYIITEIPATLVMPDDTERSFTFEAPNSKEGPYEIELQPVRVQDDFDNSNFQIIKGYSKWRFLFRIRYDRHKMNTIPVATAKQIKLKVPVYLWEDSRYYQEFTCTRRTEAVLRKPINSIYAQGAGILSNHIPNGPEVFEFLSQTYEWDDVEDLIMFLHPETPITNEGEELTGFALVADTGDGLGFEIKAYSPAEFETELSTTIKVGKEYFTIESILMESNED